LLVFVTATTVFSCGETRKCGSVAAGDFAQARGFEPCLKTLLNVPECPAPDAAHGCAPAYWPFS
jgi:hypothetical protein